MVFQLTGTWQKGYIFCMDDSYDFRVLEDNRCSYVEELCDVPVGRRTDCSSTNSCPMVRNIWTDTNSRRALELQLINRIPTPLFCIFLFTPTILPSHSITYTHPHGWWYICGASNLLPHISPIIKMATCIDDVAREWKRVLQTCYWRPRYSLLISLPLFWGKCWLTALRHSATRLRKICTAFI